MANKKRIATSVAAAATAAALLLGGTFAWQSINQTALNEASDVINPGGRLHDDFNGTNKDVYVENFADEAIFARVRLDEYFEITMNKGTAAEKPEIVTEGADKDDVDTYVTHYFDAANATDEYWDWTTGGETVYMPTFNLNKDSLQADINGTYAGPDGVEGVNEETGEDDKYTDYVEYADGEELSGTEIYDADTNNVDEVGADFENLDNYSENIVTVSTDEDGNEIYHTAKYTDDATLISMSEWLEKLYETDDGEGNYDADALDNYWVYDADGWVYYSKAIQPDSATGLLLNGIELNQVMDDSWYYAINVVGQFVTANDVGKTDNSGFYADGETVSDDAATLLAAIGVDMSGEAASPDDGGEDEGDENTLSIEFNREFINAASGSSISANIGETDVTEVASWTVVNEEDDSIIGSVAYDGEEDSWRITVPQPGMYTVTAEYDGQTATTTLAADYNWEYEVNVVDNEGNASVSDCFSDDVTSLQFTATRYYGDRFDPTETENLTNVTWTILSGDGTITSDGVYTPADLNGAFVSDPITVSVAYTDWRGNEIVVYSGTYYIYDNTYHTVSGLSQGGSVGDGDASLIVIPFDKNDSHGEATGTCGLIQYAATWDDTPVISDKTLYIIPNIGSHDAVYEAWMNSTLATCPHCSNVAG